MRLMGRMFEKPAPSRRRSSIAPPAPAQSIPGQPNTFALPPPAQSGPSRQSTGHGRRSSIQNINAVCDVGEGSVDMSIEESEDGIAPHDQDTEDEEDMSMEMTQSYGGGIIHQQQQVEEGDESFMTETSTRSDEEKTMDFTVAIGGFLPPQPPTGAKKGRASLGYTHLNPTGVQNLVPGEEEDMEMDETIAFGGIINNNNIGDDTISTNGSDDTINGRERTMTFNFGDIRTAAAEEQATMELEVEMDMSMDMTTVGGGIHSHQHSHIHAHAHIQQPINIFAQSTSTTPKSPHRTLTRPSGSGSTPSFARPTTSSAQKAKSPEKTKRNIFGPSPSPAKSMTPRKSGMGIAGEVAKRLSFGSASGSVHGSAKRTRPEEEEEDEEMVKRQKSSTESGLGLGDSIFGRPRLSASLPEEIRGTPRKSLAPAYGTPRKSLAPEPSRGTPRKSMAPPQITPARTTPMKSTPAKSPRKSMFPTSSIHDEADEEEEMSMEMEEEVRGEDWEAPPIGLTRFLEMAGVEFVDELPIISRRKSSRGLGEGSRGEFFNFSFSLLCLGCLRDASREE